jgi:hypothetical protein
MAGKHVFHTKILASKGGHPTRQEMRKRCGQSTAEEEEEKGREGAGEGGWGDGNLSAFENETMNHIARAVLFREQRRGRGRGRGEGSRGVWVSR